MNGESLPMLDAYITTKPMDLNLEKLLELGESISWDDIVTEPNPREEMLLKWLSSASLEELMELRSCP